MTALPRTFTPMDPSPLLELLEPGMRIFVSGTMSEPRTLSTLLRDHKGALKGIEIVDTRLPGFRNETHDGADCTITTFFMTPGLEASTANVRFVPQHYRETYRYLETQEFDLALIEVAPTEDSTRFSHSLANDFVGAVLHQTATVVAEVNHALPAPPGAPTLGAAKINLILHSEIEPRCALPGGPADEITRRIANHTASLIRDGDCLQMGLGQLPNAMLDALIDHRDLGCHSGMIGDGIRRLTEAGVLTNRRKSIDNGRTITGFAFGSPDLYAWLSDRNDIQFCGVNYTHDFAVLSSIDNFVSINSAVEVDLFGQSNAEMVRGRQISGTGGAVDFMRGAAGSVGGRSIVAMASTAAAGKLSKITASLSMGVPATVARTDIDHVVTEFGIASLRNRSLEERAEALIAIAHPDFQAALSNAWTELRGR